MPIIVEGNKEYRGERTFEDGRILSRLRIFNSSLPPQRAGQNLDAYLPAFIRNLHGHRGWTIDVSLEILSEGVRLYGQAAGAGPKVYASHGQGLTLWVPRTHLETIGLLSILRVKEDQFVVSLKAPPSPLAPTFSKPWAF